MIDGLNLQTVEQVDEREFVFIKNAACVSLQTYFFSTPKIVLQMKLIHKLCNLINCQLNNVEVVVVPPEENSAFHLVCQLVLS